MDDHSRFVVVAAVLERPSGVAVVEAFLAAMQWGVPFEVLTDNGKQFTSKFTRPLPVEVLFERTWSIDEVDKRLFKRKNAKAARALLKALGYQPDARGTWRLGTSGRAIKRRAGWLKAEEREMDSECMRCIGARRVERSTRDLPYDLHCP